jgi:hypothetical protein
VEALFPVPWERCGAMTLDPRVIQDAERAFSAYLQVEAEQQRAYLFRFPDGRISVELEWLDVHSIAHAVVAAYVASLDENGPHPL